MALFGPKPHASRARPGHSVGGIIVSMALSLLAWPLLASGANGPATGARIDVPAYLVAEGDDLILTGSVAHLFRTSMFSGPNRSEKTNRARLTPSGIDVSTSFDSVRSKLAAMREPTTAPPLAIAVASIDPAEINPALGAIDRLSPAPFPAMPAKELAYARSDIGLENLTPDAITKDSSGKKVSDKEIWCMATAIYFEARGEAYRGQVAVGQVVMNRVAHRLYPNSICGVVFQNQQMRNACQFSFACDGIPERITDKKSWAQADKIARGVIDGTLYLPEVEKATHYHATYVYPDWAPKLKKVTKIGHHIFYKFKRA